MTKSAPILKLDDIKGKKLGFEGGGLRFETMQALGASVVGMNMSDLYQPCRAASSTVSSWISIR